MIQAISKPITFDEFIEWKPEDGHYELHNGVIVEMPNPTAVSYTHLTLPTNREV